ncbi:LPS export ABC transporter periplasmic protein LptC [Pectinatus brassicae]|uniref:LPS export ABC transporter protein LptC n=1 Tax=Pectinatus brassicae TaxID=862415 RepID=A0A840UQ80_9FIRM|nr:LPS export ABC transporter periplasmic protein LptC [Pectinatus brassicae]MBB5336342.1 LPS export ABC transporter protein LptC [Pectinatus brassicae]
MKKFKQDKKKLAIYVFIIFAIGICVWAVVTKPTPENKSQQQIKKENTMKYGANTIVEEKNGKKIWEIKADNIDMNVTTKMAELKNIHGKYYGDDGKVLTITSPHGFYDDAKKNIILDKKVHAEDNAGLKFDAEKVTWDNAKALFTGEGKVKIVRDNMQATGDKIESNNGFTAFKLSGNAHIIKGVQ